MSRPRASPTALASMAKCSREVALSLRYGKRLSAASVEAVRRGNAAHALFEKETFGRAAPSSPPPPRADRPAPRDSRCFVASFALGHDHPGTETLREFRDEFLLPCGPGRRLVSLYYRLSPPLVAALSAVPGGRLLARAALLPVCLLVRLLLRRRA